MRIRHSRAALELCSLGRLFTFALLAGCADPVGMSDGSLALGEATQREAGRHARSGRVVYSGAAADSFLLANAALLLLRGDSALAHRLEAEDARARQLQRTASYRGDGARPAEAVSLAVTTASDPVLEISPSTRPRATIFSFGTSIDLSPSQALIAGTATIQGTHTSTIVTSGVTNSRTGDVLVSYLPFPGDVLNPAVHACIADSWMTFSPPSCALIGTTRLATPVTLTAPCDREVKAEGQYQARYDGLGLAFGGSLSWSPFAWGHTPVMRDPAQIVKRSKPCSPPVAGIRVRSYSSDDEISGNGSSMTVRIRGDSADLLFDGTSTVQGTLPISRREWLVNGRIISRAPAYLFGGVVGSTYSIAHRVTDSDGRTSVATATVTVESCGGGGDDGGGGWDARRASGTRSGASLARRPVAAVSSMMSDCDAPGGGGGGGAEPECDWYEVWLVWPDGREMFVDMVCLTPEEAAAF